MVHIAASNRTSNEPSENRQGSDTIQASGGLRATFAEQEQDIHGATRGTRGKAIIRSLQESAGSRSREMKQSHPARNGMDKREGTLCKCCGCPVASFGRPRDP